MSELVAPATASFAEDDLALIHAAAAGDEGARRHMAKRLLERIRVTVRYLAGDGPDAHDLVQCCLLEILRSIHTFRGEAKLETWADRVGVRTALRLLRQRRQRPEQPTEQVDVRDDREDAPDPGREMDLTRVRARLARLLEKIVPERRAVLVLHLVHGYTVPEIAELTDAKTHTVWDRLKVGRKQLRKLALREPLLREWARMDER